MGPILQAVAHTLPSLQASLSSTLKTRNGLYLTSCCSPSAASRSSFITYHTGPSGLQICQLTSFNIAMGRRSHTKLKRQVLLRFLYYILINWKLCHRKYPCYKTFLSVVLRSPELPPLRSPSTTSIPAPPCIRRPLSRRSNRLKTPWKDLNSVPGWAP